MRRRSLPYIVVACALLNGALAGCTVGPNFHQPAPPTVTAYRMGGDIPRDAGAPRLDPAANIDFDWWRLFHSPALDALVARAIANNPQVEGAQARLRAAQAQLRAGYGAFFPAVGVSFDATRQKYSPTKVGQSGTGSVFSLFTPSIAVSYALDLFGGNRRVVEGLKAQTEQQQQITRATYLTLASTVASTAIARAEYHEQADALAAIVDDEAEELHLAQVRVSAGTDTYGTQLALQGQLETSRATLSEARQKAEQADSLLAILLGDPPAAAKLPDLKLADFQLPETLPLRLPSTLVRQRPDILAAESVAHAASAQVGVATAAMLPDITLNAGMGSSSNSFEKLFSAGTGVWNYGAAVTAPVFEGGSLINRRKAAQADYQAAMADYRQTVLLSFEQVADTLSAIDQDSYAGAAQTRADSAAQTAHVLISANHEAGLASDIDLLASDTQARQARIALLASQAVRLQDCVALFAALGGGWWP